MEDRTNDVQQPQEEAIMVDHEAKLLSMLDKPDAILDSKWNFNSKAFGAFFGKVDDPKTNTEGFVCLLCYVENREVQMYSIATGQYRSNLDRRHTKNLPEDQQLLYNQVVWDQAKSAVLDKFPNMYFSPYTCKRRGSAAAGGSKKQLKLTLKKAVGVRDMLQYNEPRIKQALYFMMTSQSSRTVENPYYNDFLASLNPAFKSLSEKTEPDEEVLIYGLCYSILVKRIADSAAYFNGQPFISLQGDAWTSSGSLHVFGLSITFYDVSLKRPQTYILKAEPLKEGKTQAALEEVTKIALNDFKIETEWVLQAIADGEKSVQNALFHMFPQRTDRCLAHVLQNIIRKALCSPSKKYGRAIHWEAAWELWQKIRAVVNHLSAYHGLAEKALMAIQS